VAHAADRLATTITPLESAQTIEEAFDEANGLGTPGQNLVVADRSGRIGWSVYGAIPRRVGIDGVLPSSWADGSHGWKGWLDRAEYPRILNPPGGRIWTANARVVGGQMLEKLGDGGYEVGIRARQIRDRLMARSLATRIVPSFVAFSMPAGAGAPHPIQRRTPSSIGIGICCRSGSSRSCCRNATKPTARLITRPCGGVRARSGSS
jgi:hypothetical protein